MNIILNDLLEVRSFVSILFKKKSKLHQEKKKMLKLIFKLWIIRTLPGWCMETTNNCLPWILDTTWESQNPFYLFFIPILQRIKMCFLAFVLCPTNIQLSHPGFIIKFIDKKKDLPFLYSFHILSVHKTICAHFICWDMFMYSC